MVEGAFQTVIDEEEPVFPLMHRPLCDQPQAFAGSLDRFLDRSGIAGIGAIIGVWRRQISMPPEPH
jgi:hypothetical protein